MGLAIRSGDAEHLVLPCLAAVGLLDGVVLVFEQALPIEVLQCWLSPSLGGLGELMVEGQVGVGCQSTHQWCLLRSMPQSVSNDGVLDRSLVRSKQTCFFVGPWGNHSVADPGREWEYPAVCIGPLSDHILLTPSPWIPIAGTGDEA